MKYIETEKIELKALLTEDTKTEIVAFLNSYLGGKIFVGVKDNGKVINLTQEEKDLNESKIINWIRDESIYPNCSEFVEVKYNEDDVLVISINPGDSKPYYLKEKGPKPSGVYIRYGRNKSQASYEEITRMIMESNNIFYEEMISSVQDLTFNTLKLKFEEKNLDFKEFKMITSGFLNNSKYTNLAFIFSDQYDVETKFGVYIGLDRAVFKSKKEFGGSIIKQIDNALEYYDLCNETRIVIDGSPMRKEYVSYHKTAVREAILNCYCHRDYNKRSNIKIEFFDNRCEIISPGGFYGGLTLEEALNGVQSFRNKFLVLLLHKLGYIENYSSGLDRIFKEYKNNKEKPFVETSLNMFKVTFPNMNYNFLEKKEQNKNNQENAKEHQKNTKEKVQEKILELIKDDLSITRKRISETLKLSDSKIKYCLEKMREKGIIEYNGNKKFGCWKVIGMDNSKNKKINEENDQENAKEHQKNTKEKVQEKILELIKDDLSITRKRISETLKLSDSKIKYCLEKMREKGIIEYNGNKKFGCWKVIGMDNSKDKKNNEENAKERQKSTKEEV